MYSRHPRTAKAQDDFPEPHPRRLSPGRAARARIEAARAEREAGVNPLGLLFPSPKGKQWRSSNFNRNVLKPAYLAAGWRDADGNGGWTWHSLRHVFCTTALFTWKLDPTDVSCMAGHANVPDHAADMYVGTTAGVLDRARTGHRVTTPGRDEGPGTVHAGGELPGSSSPSLEEQHA